MKTKTKPATKKLNPKYLVLDIEGLNDSSGHLNGDYITPLTSRPLDEQIKNALNSMKEEDPDSVGDEYSFYVYVIEEAAHIEVIESSLDFKKIK